jgi:cytochrome c oxidase cbb3-type subunit 3
MPRPHVAIVAALSSAFLLGALAAGGCRGRTATREWRADDHDDEQQPTQVAPTMGSGSGGKGPQPTPEDEARMLVEAAWSSNCAVCHGRMGLGDGPQGPMVKAPNLTDKAFHERVSDEQIAAVIKNGRNKMPAFPSLPPAVVSGLVARIRSLRPPQ